ncbi:DsbA family oxidoreductase [Paenarthrobacter sp. PH39-S1]|uniref:DsbA family oxidoreductase n=1 Tax=Paenarthrobacter sp. PH39-S1 TaxID=3046204 RepID=UPI0024B8E1D2|nr:DsbA family oxidoreductase [Paenarthrobacter sp. PH39-S1]MDJ0354860.1 DsbA family oxidoreductase [Paenarthrobacter sp. PH39-S1]
MKIEIWSDVVCPWCYIGKRRFETALAAFEHKADVEVQWRSYQLDPSLPEHYDGTELDYLSERKGMAPDNVRQMFGHVTEQAAAEGLSYDFDKAVVANSFKAHQLLHLAAAHGKGDDVKEALLSAHFEHGEDIGSRDFLLHTGTAVGLPTGEITQMLETDKYADDVRADFDEASRLGVTGVPFFVIDRKYAISGAQPAELFGQALNEGWAEAHPLVMVNQPGGNGYETDDSGEVCGPDGCAATP